MSGVEPLSAPVLEAAETPVVARLERVRRWTGILSAYFTAQTLTQLLGIAAGLLFVRYMPVGEFALYTLATSVITFFAFVTDLGSTSSLLHFFQKAGQVEGEFGRYVGAVVSLRRWAFLVGAIAVLAAFPASAVAKGFGPLEVALATIAVLLTVALQIGSSVRILILRLEDRLHQSYVAEGGGAATRLVLALAMMASSAMKSWLGLLAGAAGTALTLRLARSSAHPASTAWEAAELRPYRRAVLSYLVPTLPSAVYFSLQGPLVIWLAASFGQTSNIAQVGALGRLGMIVAIFSNLSAVVFLPRLARILDEGLWRRRAVQFGALLLAIGSALLVLGWLAPEPLLWILGGNYAALDAELMLVLGSAATMLLAGYTVGLCFSRGWTRAQPILTAIQLAFHVGFVFAFDLSTTAGVLGMSLAVAVVGVLLQLGYIVVASRRAAAG